MNKIKQVLLVILTLSCFMAVAQQEEEVSLQWGDTLYFGDCNGESYTYIDFYLKTRFEHDTIDFDTINGFRYFDKFTATGDFDVSRLSCRYAGQYAVIKHIMALPQEDGKVINVILGMVENGVSMVYLLEDAFIKGEVLVSPAVR